MVAGMVRTEQRRPSSWRINLAPGCTMGDAIEVALHHLAAEGLCRPLLQRARERMNQLGRADDPGPSEIGRADCGLWFWRDCAVAEVQIPLVVAAPDDPF